MLRFCAAGLLCLFLSRPLFAQSTYLKEIPSYALSIAYAQTTNIIFPYAIQSVDRGSPQVLAQKAKGVNNILQLKAARKGFLETNVSVVTADGQLYAFIVRYAERPPMLNVSVEKRTGEVNKALLEKQPVTADTLQAVAARINALPAKRMGRVSGGALRLQLRSVLVDTASLWLTMQVSNFSAVGFPVDIIRFYVQEKKQARRTAVQQRELAPLYLPGMPTVRSCRPLVFSVAFAPFAIKSSQRLVVQVGERSGARLLRLPIRRRTLLTARPLP